MNFREYNPEKDKSAVNRIWYETGWLEKGKEDCMDAFLASCTNLVSDINEQPECLVSRLSGDILYNTKILPFSCIAAVTTSIIARKQGIAKRLTANAIALDAINGAAVSGLGIFDQGFYNILGYGNGSYVNILSFDPAQLRLNIKPRIPSRFTESDFELVHKSRLNRYRTHGSVNLHPAQFTFQEMKWESPNYCLGYKENDIITHGVMFTGKDLSSGPLKVIWMIYQNLDQFLELLELISNMSDQIRMVRLKEPPYLQIQDFLDSPFANYSIREKGKFETANKAIAYWQMRICNLEKCIQCISIENDKLDFNLILTDPIDKYVSPELRWKGLNGEYTVQLGEDSKVKTGINPSLPTLKSSINTFTRLWLGVLPASSLILEPDFSCPKELQIKLDRIFNYPKPFPDWDF